MGEEGVVFVEALAEAQAGVEDDFVTGDSGGSGGFEAGFEFAEDEGEDFVWGEGWEVRPFVGAAAGVHEDCSAGEAGAGGGHGGVPEVTAYVVDDLGSGFDGELGGAGVEGVYREDGFGFCFENGFDDGEDADLLFAGGEGGGVGAGGFAADVEDVGSFVEHLKGLGYGSVGGVFGGVEVAAVGEGVGCDVEDAHDEGSLAEGKGSGAEAPVEMGTGALARGEGHGGILSGGLGPRD